MDIFFIIMIGILGILIGSFLNVIILRMNTGKGIGGRSQCLSCNHQLAWYELIPIISFILQRGRCRHCRTRISWQYPFVEILTGILFIGVGLAYAPLEHPILFLFWLILISLGMIIAVYDIRHYVIPERPLWLFFLFSVMLGMHGWGFVLVPLPFLILWKVSQGAWIGFGDVELMACAGILLGVSGGFSSVMLAFWTATIVVLPWVGLKKILGKKFSHHIPFGPFLLIGIYLVGIAGVDVFKLVASVLQ